MVGTAMMNEIIKVVADIAPKYPCISRIGVFGSYGRGDYDATSDIDLLYDYDSKMKEATHQFLSFVEDFLDKIKPLEADFVFMKNLLAKDDDFKRNALNDVVWIYHGKMN